MPEHEVRRLVPRESPVTSPDGPLSPADTALLETLVLQAPVAFAFYGTDLRYRRINRMLAEINGLPMADHVGQLPASSWAISERRSRSGCARCSTRGRSWSTSTSPRSRR